MLGHSLHGKRTRKHPVYPAGGGDSITGYIVYTVLEEGGNNRGFEIPLLTTRVIFRLPLLFLHELMNYAGTIHMATPDHDSIIAPVI